MMGRVGWITPKSYNILMEVLNVTAEKIYIVHEYMIYKIVKLKFLTKVGHRTKQWWTQRAKIQKNRKYIFSPLNFWFNKNILVTVGYCKNWPKSYCYLLFSMLCRHLLVVGAPVFGLCINFHLFIVLMLNCKSAHCHQVQYAVHTFILMLHFSYFFYFNNSNRAWTLYFRNRFYWLYYMMTEPWKLKFNSIQYAKETEQCKPC